MPSAKCHPRPHGVICSHAYIVQGILRPPWADRPLTTVEDYHSAYVPNDNTSQEARVTITLMDL